jgi:PHD/YefM family antitoxin component YafN of YafNO toxin-antitoxin module
MKKCLYFLQYTVKYNAGEIIMIAISTTELRKNLKKYLNLATREKVVVRFNKSETVEIVPGKKVTVKDESFDNTRLLEVLKRGEEDIAAGRFTEIKDPKNIWASIL